MKFLLLFIFFIFGFGMLLFSILRGVGQMIFGKQSYNNHSGNSNPKSHFSTNERSDNAKKIFNKNEGEYVNYEEIKE